MRPPLISQSGNLNRSTTLIQLCVGLANRCSSSAAASCESYSLVLRQTQLFFDSSFSSGFCFPEVLFFPQVRYFQFLVPKVSIQPNSFTHSSTVSESLHLIPETHHQRKRALRTCNTVHRPADMFMLQLGWESSVGSNYMCLVLLRILAAACSTFGPKGPRVERDMLYMW